MNNWKFGLLPLFMKIYFVNSQNIYNYYELALQKWCSNDYMIHGLWPQINVTEYPVYCEDVDYNEPIEPLLYSMQHYWKECDNELWRHEWEKHGSCIKQQNNISEHNFFNKTLELFFLIQQGSNNKCKDQKDCIVACFDLDYNVMNCP